MIKMQLIGHLGKDATINTVSGKQVINFSVCHTEKFRSGDELKEKSIWVDCAYWNESKVSEYLKKGTLVYVEGTPDIRTWESNGKSGATLTLRVFSVQLLGGNQQPQPQQQNKQQEPEIVDDLPF